MGGNNNDAVYDLLDQGQFFQVGNKKDSGSNEETFSSWSSSEEALAACEGLIFNVPLDGGTKCHENATDDQLKSSLTEVTVIKCASKIN